MFYNSILPAPTLYYFMPKICSMNFGLLYWPYRLLRFSLTPHSSNVRIKGWRRVCATRYSFYTKARFLFKAIKSSLYMLLITVYVLAHSGLHAVSSAEFICIPSTVISASYCCNYICDSLYKWLHCWLRNGTTLCDRYDIQWFFLLLLLFKSFNLHLHVGHIRQVSQSLYQR